jgi:drug/metabolite transporter (DMT)-like permease
MGVIVLGYVALVGSATVYAIGIVAQSVAARRAERRDKVDPRLLARLASDRVYVLGFLAQVTGFVLAFLARATLPLYLVQAGASSAVGLAAVFGVLVLGWRIVRSEIVVLAVMAAGLLLLVGAARPSVAAELPASTGFVLLGVLVVTAVLAVPAWKLPGAVPLGVLAGCAFAVVAIASRPLAAGPLLELPLRPLAWLMVASAVVGQTLLAGALQRGSTTATAAAMDATTVVLASVAGLVVLGDRIAEGREWWVAAGLTLVVGGVLAMSRLSATVGKQALSPGGLFTSELAGPARRVGRDDSLRVRT